MAAGNALFELLTNEHPRKVCRHRTGGRTPLPMANCMEKLVERRRELLLVGLYRTSFALDWIYIRCSHSTTTTIH